MLRDWLGWKGGNCLLSGLLRGIQRSKMSKFRKGVITACLAALVYWIWACRNGIIWNEEQMGIDEVVRRVKKGVKERLLVMGCTASDSIYIENLLIDV